MSGVVRIYAYIQLDFDELPVTCCIVVLVVSRRFVINFNMNTF